MANRRFTQFFNTLHNRPVLLDCNFSVDLANVNGLGISGLKGPGIQNVFMRSTAAFTGTSHTSTLIDGIASTANLVVGMPVQGSGIAAGTKIAAIVDGVSIRLSAATGSSTTGSITYQGVGNPNPASGYAVIQLQDTYNKFFNGYSCVLAPSSGPVKIDNGATLTIGNPYVISTLGDATAAQWLLVGVPIGITPAVGVSFIAIATGGGSGNTSTSRVSVPASSGISSVEFVGLPDTTLKSSAANVLGISSGAYIMAKFLGPSFAGSALGTHTHDFTVIGGQAASTTNNIANYAGPIIGKQEATNATYLGSASATNGGVVAVSAGTPAGTISFAAAAPTTGSVVSFGLYLSNSSIIVQGE